MDALGEGIEADEEEEWVHRDLHDAQHGRAPEKDEGAMDKGVQEQEEGEEEECGLGECGECEGEEDEDLENGGQSAARQ